MPDSTIAADQGLSIEDVSSAPGNVRREHALTALSLLLMALVVPASARGMVANATTRQKKNQEIDCVNFAVEQLATRPAG